MFKTEIHDDSSLVREEFTVTVHLLQKLGVKMVFEKNLMASRKSLTSSTKEAKRLDDTQPNRLEYVIKAIDQMDNGQC